LSEGGLSASATNSDEVFTVKNLDGLLVGVPNEDTWGDTVDFSGTFWTVLLDQVGQSFGSEGLQATADLETSDVAKAPGRCMSIYATRPAGVNRKAV
jgi:hypothetical protein